ncbi:MAG: hypothetical protein HRT44_10235 [Bdellovibrionales bacterium]|nr:hypothetical protein [Bdellovibrionales bacterium]NQZ19618.1 hypothetical protein [Bdellovibrionales bacterium]
MNKPNQLDTVSKPSFIDFVMSFTDIEKGIVGTFRSMAFEPSKVIEADLMAKGSFISPFKFLTVSMFVSISLLTLFFKPDTIGGEFYKAWLENFLASGEMLESITGEKQELNIAHFDKFFEWMTSYYSWSYKLGVFISILCGSLVTFKMLKDKSWSFNQHIVINARVFSQVLIYSCILSLPLYFWPIGFWNLQYWNFGFQLLFGFIIYRKILKNQVEKYNRKALWININTTILSFLILFSMGVVVGFFSEMYYPVWN